MGTDNRGLGSENMDENVKREIQSKGGKASRSGGDSSASQSGVITNHAGGGALDKEAQRKGGQNSQRS
jgi:hypothetical protein